MFFRLTAPLVIGSILLTEAALSSAPMPGSIKNGDLGSCCRVTGFFSPVNCTFCATVESDPSEKFFAFLRRCLPNMH